jgi:hypothetical protein
VANPGVPDNGKYLSSREIRSLLGSFLGDTSQLNIDRRKSYGKQAGRIYSDQLSSQDQNQGLMGAGAYLRDNYDQDPNAGYVNSYVEQFGVSALQAAEEAAGGSKVAFTEWDVPTSSTNYARPRTVAAGYDEKTQVMTVVFRDGTFYNYYEVSPTEWEAFHASYSKGSPWLNKKNSNQAGDGLFIQKPRGEVTDLEDMDPRIREALYRVARTQQQKAIRQPKKGRTTQSAPLYNGTTKVGSTQVQNQMKANKPLKAHSSQKPKNVRPSSHGNRKVK